MNKPAISMVAALGKDRAIGNGNKLLWHIPDDLKRFKELTVGHPVIMGRKTFESIVASLGTPLPDRTNIVITRDPNWEFEKVLVAHSFEEALALAKEIDNEEIFIVGGAQIYEQALPCTERLYLTLINDEKESDVFFPPYEHVFTKKILSEEHEWNDLKYRWITVEK